MDKKGFLKIFKESDEYIISSLWNDIELCEEIEIPVFTKEFYPPAIWSYLEKNNIASIDWNALNADAEGRKKNAQELADYAIKTSQGKDIVVLLMHDTYGKEETAKALPTIIKYFKDNGYEFKTLS